MSPWLDPAGTWVFDGQAIDPGLAAQAVLARVVEHHVLDHLEPLGVGRLDELPVTRPGDSRRGSTR